MAFSTQSGISFLTGACSERLLRVRRRSILYRGVIGSSGRIVLKNSPAQPPSAIFESRRFAKQLFITLLGGSTNQSFTVYPPPDFFNSIGPRQSFPAIASARIRYAAKARCRGIIRPRPLLGHRSRRFAPSKRHLLSESAAPQAIRNRAPDPNRCRSPDPRT